MDGRWSMRLAAGLLGGVVGCSTPQVQMPGDLAKQSDPPALKQLKAQQQQQAAMAASTDRPTKDKKLKPETLVKVGALKETAADDADRPQVEREGFRYQARQSYQKAIEQNPNYVPAYLALIGSYLRTEETEKAHGVFQKALAANPRDPSLWFEQGTIHARDKNWTAALESLDQAARLDPENKHYVRTYGLALARVGRIDDAYSALAKCMNESDARYSLARMCDHMKHPDVCTQQLELALRANPNHAGARELWDSVSGGGVKTAKFEEINKPNAAVAGSPEPVKPAAVLMGGAHGATPVPVKVGFD